MSDVDSWATVSDSEDEIYSSDHLPLPGPVFEEGEDGKYYHPQFGCLDPEEEEKWANLGQLCEDIFLNPQSLLRQDWLRSKEAAEPEAKPVTKTAAKLVPGEDSRQDTSPKWTPLMKRRYDLLPIADRHEYPEWVSTCIDQEAQCFELSCPGCNKILCRAAWKRSYKPSSSVIMYCGFDMAMPHEVKCRPTVKDAGLEFNTLYCTDQKCTKTKVGLWDIQQQWGRGIAQYNYFTNVIAKPKIFTKF